MRRHENRTWQLNRIGLLANISNRNCNCYCKLRGNNKTGWGPLRDCLWGCLQVMKRWIIMPPMRVWLVGFFNVLQSFITCARLGTRGLRFIVLIREDCLTITKAALSPQLFKDPECWSGQAVNERPPAQQNGSYPIELAWRWFWHDFCNEASPRRSRLNARSITYEKGYVPLFGTLRVW